MSSFSTDRMTREFRNRPARRADDGRTQRQARSEVQVPRALAELVAAAPYGLRELIWG